MRENSEPPGSSLQKATSWERLDCGFRTVLTVSKQDLPKKEAKWKRARARKKQAKRHT